EALALRHGALLVSSPHTTAGVTVNEGFDPDVAGDLVRRLEALAPRAGQGDRHAEGNSDSHLKVALVGSSTVIPVSDGRLVIGCSTAPSSRCSARVTPGSAPSPIGGVTSRPRSTQKALAAIASETWPSGVSQIASSTACSVA